MNIKTFCKNCLVQACCIKDGVINNPCEKATNLIYKYGNPTWNSGCYELVGIECDDSTSVFICTDVSFEDWYPKRYGEEKNKKRLKDIEDALDALEINKS